MWFLWLLVDFGYRKIASLYLGVFVGYGFFVVSVLIKGVLMMCQVDWNSVLGFGLCMWLLMAMVFGDWVWPDNAGKF